MIVWLFLVSVLAPTEAEATPDPLAPATRGMLQCYAPNLEKKTCQSLSGYKQRADGAYDNTAIVLLSPSPIVTMETVTRVTTERGAVCGSIRTEDIDSATIVVAGTKLDEQRAVAARGRIASAMSALMGKQVCTTYVQDGSQLRAEVSIDGTRSKKMDQQVVWVAPSDGYIVAP